jgi:hypothetical protein
MKKFSIGNHLTPYLLVACTLLAGILALESLDLVQAQGDASPEKRSAASRIEWANFTAPKIAAFSEITERPLFSEDREPPAEPVQTATVAKISQLRLQLEGVAITPGAKIALLRDLTSNKMLHLATGDTHQGWELTSITNTVATFERGEQTQELPLNKDKASSGK